MSYSEILSFTESLAREAGALIVRERTAGMQQDFKLGKELVTSADLNADRLIRNAILARYPQHSVLSEELAPDLATLDKAEDSLWIVDPIDGTVNFAHGHAQSAVSIAYVHAGQIRCGVVFNPFTDELFSAQQGQGAFLNDRRIRVGTQTDLSRCLIATGFPYQKDRLEPLLDRLRAVLQHCADIRRLGSAALDICWVAAGRLDGYYENLSIWDFAAAQLIATEAGACYGHIHDLPPGVAPQFHCENVLIANPALFPQLQKILRAADAIN